MLSYLSCKSLDYDYFSTLSWGKHQSSTYRIIDHHLTMSRCRPGVEKVKISKLVFAAEQSHSAVGMYFHGTGFVHLCNSGNASKPHAEGRVL